VEALHELHQPTTPLRHEQARERLAFEEFLVPQLILARRRWECQHEYDGPVFTARETMPDLVARMVDFTPTSAQLRVLAEIEADLRDTHPMNRLLQGDVGSGKTLVAAGALAFTVLSGAQAAIMAPTEILAEQLALVLTRLLRPLGIKPTLLTGTLSASERRESLTALASGAARIAVGTHALIQDGVEFHDLGLSIVDEQHRFGVEQRATLRRKGKMVNALVMTATPIPRTLSMTLYGDLDVSVLDDMPPGRHPVETRWLSTQGLRNAYRFILAQIAEGRQAYVLCPLVEQSDLLQADAATEMAAELARVFPDLRIGLLHGRLRPEEKDAAMEAFRAGETNILACTTVIEVGVDVPNATVMLIHNAERFGLAQLHQLRGRVGRAQYQSYCLLVTHARFDPNNHDAEETPGRKRLRILLGESCSESRTALPSRRRTWTSAVRGNTWGPDRAVWWIFISATCCRMGGTWRKRGKPRWN
jgi:ATP-dependent DNA helicase RecG